MKEPPPALPSIGPRRPYHQTDGDPARGEDRPATCSPFACRAPCGRSSTTARRPCPATGVVGEGRVGRGAGCDDVPVVRAHVHGAARVVVVPGDGQQEDPRVGGEDGVDGLRGSPRPAHHQAADAGHGQAADELLRGRSGSTPTVWPSIVRQAHWPSTKLIQRCTQCRSATAVADAERRQAHRPSRPTPSSPAPTPCPP